MPVTTDEGKADLMNSKFEAAFTSEKLDSVPDLGNSPFPSCPEINFTPNGVEKLLRKLQPHKAAGPDALSPRILKELAHKIAPSLLIIFQQIYDTGKTPRDWRDALVTPVHKKGPKYDTGNYRPVSLTSIISKINEHILCSTMMHHFSDNNILDPDQHGFRQGYSTETQLISSIHDWASTINAKGQTDVVFLDFSKAFDSVPHLRLLEKLRYYGVGGRLNRLLGSLLQDRRQRVVVNGSKSSWVPVRSGVPQGTVIGPILFLVYINDIKSGVTSDMRLFADDSIIYRTINTDEDHRILTEDLHKLQTWATKWQMIFKPEKCFVMNITNKRNPSFHTYSMRGTPLSVVRSWKYLGVIIDDKLNFNEHCEKTLKRAYSSLAIIQRTLYAAPIECKKIAYQSLVRPKLEYASSAWNPQTKTKIKQLEQVQNKAARFVTKSYDRDTSVSALKSSLGWVDLERRRKMHDCVMWFKIHYCFVFLPFPPLVVPKPRLARNDHNLAYLHLDSRINSFKFSFFVRTIPVWNSLSADAVSAPRPDVFQALASAQLLGVTQP